MKSLTDARTSPTRFRARGLVAGLIGAAILVASRGPIMKAIEAGDARPHLPDLGLVASQGPAVQAHLLAALAAFALSLAMLTGAKGTRLHRTLGWTWAVLMMATALSSFLITSLHPGRLSWIHLLSGWTALMTPVGVWAARSHRVRLHGRVMTGLVVGGLFVAGALTFVPGRLMWRLFFG